VKKVRFNEKADAYLDELYDSFGATTDYHKLTVLRTKLGGEYNFYCGAGEVAESVKVACLEYEILGNLGLIELHLS
jgi:hypothetical protein